MSTDPSPQPQFTPVVPIGDVGGPPWPTGVVAGIEVMVVRDDEGAVHAVVSVCPHLEAPLVGAEVAQGRLVCTRHFHDYRLSDGVNVVPGNSRERLVTLPTRVVDGMVEVASGPVA